MSILSFFFSSGAYYILDGQEKEITRNIDIKKPLWGVIDIYGNVKGQPSEMPVDDVDITSSYVIVGVVFTSPPQTTDDGKSLFAKYPQKPDHLPIRYYTNLKSEDIKPVFFSNVHGAELELYCEYKVALRKRSLVLASLHRSRLCQRSF